MILKEASPATGWGQDDDRERVRAANPIEEVVGEYLTLLPDGRNLKALCPFHAEKTPSFKVDPERGSFRCFGCGERGDVFSFVQNLENLDFRQTLELLAQRGGVTLTRRWTQRDRVPATGMERSQEYELLHFAQEWFRSELRGSRGQAAREYLNRRGFRPETIDRFGVGYAPTGWSNLTDRLRREKASLSGATALGILRSRDGDDGGHYDAFRGRIMFPIRDLPGRVVGFGGRLLEGSGGSREKEEPKYLNTPESHLFRKGQLLYGLHEGRAEVRKQRSLLLMEGYTDVMMSHQAGFPTAVATLGTALTEANVDRLSRLSDRVVLLFDGDRAGREAARKGIELTAGTALEVTVVLLGESQDPCDLLAGDEGPAQMERLVESGRPGLEFVLDMLEATHGVESAERKDRIATEFFRLVEKLPSEIRRREGLHVLAGRLRLPESTVLRDFARRSQPTRRRRETRPGGGVDNPEPSLTIPQDGDAILMGAISAPERAETIFALLEPESFRDPVHGVLARTIKSSGGDVQLLSLEDPRVKSKYLELVDTIEERGFDEGRAVSLLRDVLIRKLERRAREIRATLDGDLSRPVKERLLGDYQMTRGDIARVRGETEEDWSSLRTLAERHFGATESGPLAHREAGNESPFDMESV